MAQSILEKIYKASLKFLVPLTPEETYATIVSEAIKLVKAEWGSILLLENGELRRAYSSNPALYRIPIRKKGFTYRAFKAGRPVVLRGKDISRVHPEIKELGIVSDVIIPLSYRGKSIGILAVLSQKEAMLNRDAVGSLILFGSMASLAIRKTQLHDETKKALEIRDLFISMAAHELKTPVTTIFGYSQLMQQNRKDGKEIKEDWINALHAECSRLSLLINDLLEISRINTKHLHYVLRECSIAEITNCAIDGFRFNHPGRKIVIINHTKGDVRLIGDFDRLLQVLINLLDNAVKFSADDSKIVLSMKTSGSTITLKLKDQGKGIAKEDLPRVFEQYYKGLGTAHEGLGLGLFLAKDIIEQHHGSIRLFSALNKGTTVEVKLPRLRA